MNECHIQVLRDEADWHAIREECHGLHASGSLENPWGGWQHAYDLWRLFYADRRAWWIRLDQHDVPLATALWLEDRKSRRYGELRTLRSFDQMTVCQPPFWSAPDREAMACRALAEALPEIAQRTRCHLVRLHRVQGRGTREWIRELRQRQLPHRSRVFTISHGLDLPDDWSQYLQGRAKRANKEVRRHQRQLERKLGPLRFRRWRGLRLNHESFEEAWTRFEHLRRSSWQLEWAASTGSAEPQRIQDYYQSFADHWRREQALDLSLLYAGEQVVAGSANLIFGSRLWGVLLAYDQQYRALAPGKVLFARMLKDGHARGDRRIEFGGEDNAWKERWARDSSEVQELEWALGGWKGRLWAWAQKLKTPSSQIPA